MSRVKGGVRRVKHRRALHRLTKGFQGGRKNLIKVAKVAAIKAGSYAYADRRKKKRNARALWQIQINAGARMFGMSYSKFMNGLKKKGVALDRKVLADIAKKHPKIFEQLASLAKTA